MSSPAPGPPASSEGLPFGEDAPIFAVMQTMRAMRRLQPDPVPRELLEKVVAAATWAPSASNTQAYGFVVVDDREQMRRLAEAWMACLKLYEQISVRASSMSEEQYAKLKAAVKYQGEHFAETPAVIVACYDNGDWNGRVQRNVTGLARGMAAVGGKRSATFMRNLARSGPMAEAASVYPGIQNLLLAARAEGLGAVLTTWHLFYEQEFKAILGIPKNVKTFAIVPVGWPKGKFGPVNRRPAAEAIHWDRW
jgi:nitroreductase